MGRQPTLPRVGSSAYDSTGTPARVSTIEVLPERDHSGQGGIGHGTESSAPNGPSPPTRVTLRDTYVTGRDPGTVPAYGGTRHRGGRPERVGRGPSPPTRGTPPTNPPSVRTHRTIPACAGNTPSHCSTWARTPTATVTLTARSRTPRYDQQTDDVRLTVQQRAAQDRVACLQASDVGVLICPVRCCFSLALVDRTGLWALVRGSGVVFQLVAECLCLLGLVEGGVGGDRGLVVVGGVFVDVDAG